MLPRIDPAVELADPALPGWNSVLQPEVMAPYLFGSASDSMRTASLTYLRYKPGRRLIALYRQELPPCHSTQTALWVVSALTAEGFVKRCRKISQLPSSVVRDHIVLMVDRQVLVERFPFDLELPTLRKLQDPLHRKRIVRRLVASVPDEPQITTLAYKPARRYVGKVGDGDSGVVIKSYGRRQYISTKERLLALSSTNLSVPEVVGVSDRYQTLAIEWLSGLPLHAFLHERGQRVELMLHVGGQLAVLHKKGLDWKSRNLPQTGLPPRSLTRIANDMLALNTDLGQKAVTLVDSLVQRLEDQRPTMGFIHGDFYNKQVVTDGRSVRFIDFDQCHFGDIYQDLGNFVAQLYWRCHLGEFHRSWIDEAVYYFIDGYQRESQSGWDSVRFHQQVSAGLVRCILHPFRHAIEDWEQVTLLLLQDAEYYLNHSMRGRV